MLKTKKKTKEQKLRILAAGDMHGDKDIAQRLAEKARKKKVDLVVLAGDIHGALQGSGDILEPFKKANQKVVFVPGNWDTSLEAELLKKQGSKNVDGYYVNYKGVDIIGVGSPNFQMQLNEKKALKQLNENFEKIKTKDGKKILVSHIHAQGTKSEFSGFAGSKALRKVIEKFQPDVFISGHIHEAEGIEEKIGKTKVVGVGRGGVVLEI